MEYELTLWMAALLLASGLFAGFINTIAGGGSMLTLPVLIMLGLPADIANGTNRLGVLAQSVTGAGGYGARRMLDTGGILPVLLPTGAGALLGALLAAYMPVWILKPILLGTMIALALVMLISPGVVAAPPGTKPRALRDRPIAAVSLFFAGIYGGFVQAGVGFILIAAIAGGLRYDFIGTNALKTVCTAVFSGVSLIVFTAMGQVLWIPGGILAAGCIVGALLSVRFAVRASQKTLKWILFVMVSATCVAAMLS